MAPMMRSPIPKFPPSSLRGVHPLLGFQESPEPEENISREHQQDLKNNPVTAQRLAELFLLSDKPLSYSQERDMRIHELEDMLILICGHQARDARCGVYGPLLRDGFIVALLRAGVDVVSSRQDRGTGIGGVVAGHARKRRARVALTSHVGGHQFAGNVGIWMPRDWGTMTPSGLFATEDDAPNALAGCGVWYGRVEPKHVEGVVEETVNKGRVIDELLRGVVEGKAEGSFSPTSALDGETSRRWAAPFSTRESVPEDAKEFISGSDMILKSLMRRR